MLSDPDHDPETLETLMHSLQKNAKSFKTFNVELLIGEIVVAYVIDHKLWFRAKIVNYHNLPDTYIVRLTSFFSFHSLKKKANFFIIIFTNLLISGFFNGLR